MARMVQQVALVTGASRGLGRAHALALGNANYAVAVNYLSDSIAAEEVAREIRNAGGRALVVRCDVTSESQVQRMINNIDREFGRLDVLVNNAGLYEDAVVWKMTEDQWRRVVDVNLTGAFLCTKAAVPLLRRNGRGRIVNIASAVAATGMFGTANYAASKAGLFGLTKTVAKEVARFAITVNCLAFGYFRTGMFLRLPQRIQQDIIGGIPLGRPGELEEATGPLLFLLSDRADYITGQIIHVNGGWYT